MAALCVVAAAQPESPAPSASRQSLQDAWWTGPLLANSAATLPRGHFLVEPYVYDIMMAHTHVVGSRAYILYGLVDRLTVGMIPIVAYNRVQGGPSSSGIRVGDVTLAAQYRLTQFREHHWLPTTALHIEETLPNGKYDRLKRASDGVGAGAYTTMVALNTQTYVWLPTGRILRLRLNVSESLSSGADVRDVSVYGTSAGFRGRATPGRTFLVDAAGEYSLTRRWVLALDAIHQRSGNTGVIGLQNAGEVRMDSGSGWSFGVAPALEYNLSPNLGVIFGARVIAAGHNFSRSVAPVVAINYVR